MTHSPYIQIDWGIDGVEFSLKNRDILVIVDTLRFSSAVVTAIANGFTIYPVSDRVVASRFAASISADFSGKQGETKYTLSPLSFLKASKTDNKIIVLSSPNGAACAELIKEDDIAYVGCLLNAHAIGEQVTKIARKKKRNVTVIAAGEQRAIDTGERIVYEKKIAHRVFAIEDYLASGAVICHSKLMRSAEAEVCALAFESARDRLKEILLNSFSGRYLVQHKLEVDVEFAVRLNQYAVIPVIHKGKIEILDR